MQPGDLHAGRERVAHRVPALERGQQRRMRVHRPAAERVDERLRQDRAEPGDRDEIDVVALRARRRPLACRRRGRRSGRSRCARRARRRRRRSRAISSAPHGRSASTTHDRQVAGPSRARRMVPLPEARTPTRMSGTLSRAARASLARKSPDREPATCFTSRDTTTGGRRWLIGNRRRRRRLTIMVAGAVMLIVSFLRLRGRARARGARTSSRSRRCSRSTAW